MVQFEEVESKSVDLDEIDWDNYIHKINLYIQWSIESLSPTPSTRSISATLWSKTAAVFLILILSFFMFSTYLLNSFVSFMSSSANFLNPIVKSAKSSINPYEISSLYYASE